MADETKEVGFKDLELTIAKPKVDKAGVMSITGNFELLAQQITAVVNKYKGTKLTEDNVNYVAALKKQFVSLRTGIEAKRRDWKKMYLSTPETMLDAMCADLQKIVAEGENALGVQLEAYDQRRKDEVSRALNDYVATGVEVNHLRPEFAKQIVLKKHYYNKSQKESDSYDDLDMQIDLLVKAQKEYDAGVELIKAECAGTTLVVDNYVSQLQYRAASEVVLQIKNDRLKAEELYQQRKAEEVKNETEPLTVGEKVKEELFEPPKAVQPELKTLDGGEVRERTLWIRYKASQAKDIQNFLVSRGIEFKFLK